VEFDVLLLPPLPSDVPLDLAFTAWRPTVLMEYPSDQNSPPQRYFLTAGTRRKISRPSDS
jgi:hypothetical protein